MAIIITNYSEKYRDDVRNICLDTAGSNAREEKSMRFLLATFCDYYIDREAEHCFIAVDEDTDSAVGYIFCAPDYQKYKRIFKAEYLPRVLGYHDLPFFADFHRAEEVFPFGCRHCSASLLELYNFSYYIPQVKQFVNSLLRFLCKSKVM